jgi:uncharacterized membrane protein YGL010W
MKNAVEQLGMYQSYHYDRRNCATHFIGIPLIVFGIMVLFNRIGVFGSIQLGTLVTMATIMYYFRLDWALAMAMTAVLVLMQYFALQVATLPQTEWLTYGLGAFILGWIIQAVGHVFEKRRPAFTDNLMQLLIGPLFLMFEVFTALKLKPELRQAVMQHALKLHPPANSNQAHV